MEQNYTHSISLGDHDAYSKKTTTLICKQMGKQNFGKISIASWETLSHERRL